jgi:dTMP kinase
MKKGKFIMIDGLDGSGKGEMLKGVESYVRGTDGAIYDIRKFSIKNKAFPDIQDIKNELSGSSLRVVLSGEPTYAGIGAVIRDELINKSGKGYSATSIAHAYSLDREVYYKNYIIPLLEDGIHVVQERGIVTTLVYQSLQDEGMSVEEIMSLPGNKFTLDTPPDLLMITTIDPQHAYDRSVDREKDDNAIFEKLEFQKRVEGAYKSESLQGIFSSRGSQIRYIDTNPPSTIDDTHKKAVSNFIDIISQ